MSAVSIPCGVCPGEIAFGATACPSCERPVTEQDRAVLEVRREGGNFAAHDRGRRVREGSKWIGALAILFAVSGPVLFAMQKTETDKTLAQLDELDEGEELAPIHGRTYTAGEFRAQISRAPVRAFVSCMVLAVLMGALWRWARHAPLPAIACALALFVVVQLVGAVVDPASILRGIIVKLLALGALVKGLKAALAARAEMHRPPAA